MFPATEYNETQRPKMSFMIMAPPNSKLEFLVTRSSPISGQILSGSYPIPSVGISLKRRCNTALRRSGGLSSMNNSTVYGNSIILKLIKRFMYTE